MTARFVDDLKDVRYRDWEINVRLDDTRPYLQVAFADEKGERQQGRKWMLSPHMTKSEVVQTAFKAVMTAEEHEVREFFTYKGLPIFGPHFNVDALHDVCETVKPDVREEKAS